MAQKDTDWDEGRTIELSSALHDVIERQLTERDGKPLRPIIEEGRDWLEAIMNGDIEDYGYAPEMIESHMETVRQALRVLEDLNQTGKAA